MKISYWILGQIGEILLFSIFYDFFKFDFFAFFNFSSFSTLPTHNFLICNYFEKKPEIKVVYWAIFNGMASRNGQNSSRLILYIFFLTNLQFARKITANE